MKKNLLGMTLIELIVGITIIGILAAGLSQVDYRRSTDNQSAQIFQNKFISLYETVRNNALIGRSTTSAGDNALSRQMSFHTGSGGQEVQALYESPSGVYTKDIALSYSLQNSEQIVSISCHDFLHTSSGTTSTGSIRIEGQSFSLPDCADPTKKILEIKTAYKTIQKTIVINAVNGVITLQD